MQPRILIDTNVYGYAVEENKRCKDSIFVLEYAKKHRSVSYGSFINVNEFYEYEGYNRLIKLFSYSVGVIIELEIHDKLQDRDKLAWRYIQKLHLLKDNLTDARLLALSVIAEIDIIVTWNRRGIFGKEPLKRIKKINREMKYMTPEILNPREFLSRISP